MHETVNNLILIKNEIQSKFSVLPNIVAISKTFPPSKILPLINHGHVHFGENKVQEALSKWIKIKEDFNKVKLHMVGRLQSNKVNLAL